MVTYNYKETTDFRKVKELGLEGWKVIAVNEWDFGFMYVMERPNYPPAGVVTWTGNDIDANTRVSTGGAYVITNIKNSDSNIAQK